MYRCFVVIINVMFNGCIQAGDAELTGSQLWLAVSADRRVSIWSADWSRDSCELVDWLTFPAPAFTPDGLVAKSTDSVRATDNWKNIFCLKGLKILPITLLAQFIGKNFFYRIVSSDYIQCVHIKTKPTTFEHALIFIVRQHTDARASAYWRAVTDIANLSVHLSVTFRYQMKTA